MIASTYAGQNDAIHAQIITKPVTSPSKLRFNHANYAKCEMRRPRNKPNKIKASTWVQIEVPFIALPLPQGRGRKMATPTSNCLLGVVKSGINCIKHKWMSVHLTKNGICMHTGSQTVNITIYPADGSLLTKGTVFKTGRESEGGEGGKPTERSQTRPGGRP